MSSMETRADDIAQAWRSGVDFPGFDNPAGSKFAIGVPAESQMGTSDCCYTQQPSCNHPTVAPGPESY